MMIGSAELAQSTKFLADYCRLADLNLRRSDEGWLLRKIGREPFLPLDTTPMRDALTVRTSEGNQHVVVMRFEAGGGAAPLGLSLLYDMHSAILHANTILLTLAGRAPDEGEHRQLRGKWIRIYAVGAFLCELFRHAVTTIKDPQASVAFRHAIGAIPGPAEPAAQEALDAQNAAHRDRLLEAMLAASGLKNRSAADIASMLGEFAPVGLPGVMTWGDHAGAQYINDVWFPQKYAQPLLDRIAQEMAETLSRQS